MAVAVSLFLGILTAVVAWRNAKKTPHEQLKVLLEIRSTIGNNANVRHRRILERAVSFELGRIDRRTQSRVKGTWKTYKGLWSSHPYWTSIFTLATGVVFLGLMQIIFGPALISIVGWNINGPEPKNNTYFPSILFGVPAIFVAYFILRYLFGKLVDLHSDDPEDPASYPR